MKMRKIEKSLLALLKFELLDFESLDEAKEVMIDSLKKVEIFYSKDVNVNELSKKLGHTELKLNHIFKLSKYSIEKLDNLLNYHFDLDLIYSLSKLPEHHQKIVMGIYGLQSVKVPFVIDQIENYYQKLLKENNLEITKPHIQKFKSVPDVEYQNLITELSSWGDVSKKDKEKLVKITKNINRVSNNNLDWLLDFLENRKNYDLINSSTLVYFNNLLLDIS
tara:strand:+ start:344 stop:1006 length:663 start_codon:yes stop_codon:yes gene_type:complete